MTTNGMPSKAQKKWRFYAIVVGITLVLTPQYCLACFQTSIGVKDALGSYSVLVYSTLCLFSLLAYVPLSAWIGRKTCLIIGEIQTVVYTIALMYQKVWTMTIAAALMGIGESVFLTAGGVIISSFNDDGLDGTSRKDSVRLFLTTLSLGQVLVTLAPNLILKDSRTEWNTTLTNSSGSFDVSKCGSNDCPLNYAFKRTANVFGQLVPTYESLLIFLCLFGSLQIVGIILHCIVIRDDKSAAASNNNQTEQLLPREPHPDARADLKKAFNKMVTHLKSRLQLMLIPIQLQNGAFNAFLWCDATRSYFSCPFGVEHLGVYLFATYTSSFIVNVAYSKFASSLSPPVLYVVSYVFETATYVVAYSWEPSPDSFYVPALLAVMIGATNGARRLLSYLVASVYFEDLDSSYIVLTGAAAFGNSIVFAAGSFVCVYVKIYALAALSLMSTALALAAHYRYLKLRVRSSNPPAQ